MALRSWIFMVQSSRYDNRLQWRQTQTPAFFNEYFLKCVLWQSGQWARIFLFFISSKRVFLLTPFANKTRIVSSPSFLGFIKIPQNPIVVRNRLVQIPHLFELQDRAHHKIITHTFFICFPHYCLERGSVSFI